MDQLTALWLPVLFLMCNMNKAGWLSDHACRGSDGCQIKTVIRINRVFLTRRKWGKQIKRLKNKNSKRHEAVVRKLGTCWQVSGVFLVPTVGRTGRTGKTRRTIFTSTLLFASAEEVAVLPGLSPTDACWTNTQLSSSAAGGRQVWPRTSARLSHEVRPKSLWWASEFPRQLREVLAMETLIDFQVGEALKWISKCFVHFYCRPPGLQGETVSFKGNISFLASF